MTEKSRLRGLVGKSVTDLSSLVSELDSKVWEISHFEVDRVFLSMNYKSSFLSALVSSLIISFHM